MLKVAYKFDCIVLLVLCLYVPALAQDLSLEKNLGGLILEPAMHHMGKIVDNKKVSIPFCLTNNTKNPVKIKKVDASCGCIAAVPDPETIPAGGKSKVMVKVDPSGRSGYIQWSIRIFTDCPQIPVVETYLDATILKNAMLSQEYLYFGEFRRGVKALQKIWVAPQKYPEFKVLEVKAVIADPQKPVSEYFNIEFSAGVYEGFYPGLRPAYCIEIKAQETIPYGRVEGKLVIKTDIPEHNIIEIPLLARVAGEIGVRPDYLSLGIIKAGRTTKKNIYIYHREGGAFSIKKITSTCKFLNPEIQVKVPEQYYKITVFCEGKEGLPEGEFRGHLTIHTTSEQQPEIKIPIQGIIAPK